MEYTITLEAEIDAFLQSKVKAGRYGSAADVIRDALERLAESERMDERLLIGLAQADAGDTIDINDVFNELDRRLAAFETRRKP